ncbi:MAG: radical SAM protein, partial [Bacteroidia bacterium]|nr:radical SAM protein [Bacteroidia bacterium]
VEGIERIRLGSIEPTTITDEFVETAKTCTKLCPHYHISLQSGCDRTLAMMNRRYDTEQYRQVVKLLRENINDVAITTDVMVGFPGETEEDFEATMGFLEEISFAQMHVFKYSPRKGTPAATFKGQIKPEIKEERSRRVIALGEKKTLEFYNLHIGKSMPVLFEQEASGKDGYIEGLTSNYIRVVCKGKVSLKGTMKNVKMKKVLED